MKELTNEREDFDLKYPHLFENGKIGKLTLKNRVVMPGMGTNFAGHDGQVTDQLITYYEERAKGGTGLIITEYTSVDYEYGRAGFNQLRIDEDRFVPGIHRLANAVQKYGAKLFVQLQHSGRETYSMVLGGGRQIVAPSPVTCVAIGEEPRALLTEEVKETVNKFVMAAFRCKSAGVDGVELHGAHGYLINQFLSPNTNLRADEYGGSFENRMRFVEEIVVGIKQACGADFPVTIRLSVDEFEEGGMTVPLSREVVRHLEKVGVDAIHASCGNYNSMHKMVETMQFEQGWRVYLAEEMKKVVNIPVITVGVIREPEFAEKILADGRADFIAMGRTHIADPEWAKKALEGREKEIRKCIVCLYCTTKSNGHVKCSVNVRAGRELEFKELKRIEEKRNVAVVGGGPGGMEAARILSLKGYQVTLFEKDCKLGGQLNLVAAPVAKEKMNWIIQYLSNEMKRLKVDVRLNTVASIEEIKALDPYAIFLATGAKPIIGEIEGSDLPIVSDYEDVYLNKKPFQNDKIAVVGSGMVCYSITSQLEKQGNDVTLIEIPTETGSKVSAPTIAMFHNRLTKAGVKIICNQRVDEVRPKAIVISDQSGKQTKLEVDHVVFSMGTESYNPLEESYNQHFDNVFVIGDAINPGSITNAMRDGFEKAFVLESITVNKKATEELVEV